MKMLILSLFLLATQSAMAWDATFRTERGCPFQAVVYSEQQKTPLLWSLMDKARIQVLSYGAAAGGYSTYRGGELPLGVPVFQTDRRMQSIELLLSGERIRCQLESI